jgi:RHS repeat-associated protein
MTYRTTASNTLWPQPHIVFPHPHQKSLKHRCTVQAHTTSRGTNLDTTRSQAFTYDQLNRINGAFTTSTHATSPSHCWGESYTVDPWGNLNGIAPTSNSNYTGCTEESGFSTTAVGNNHLPSSLTTPQATPPAMAWSPLGTSRVIATNTGVVCYDADFYPYGGERTPYTNNCPTTNNYKFEGKERDTETGNDDFGARYYSNRFGRWLSADWSSVPIPVPYANLTNPQTLNLYSMVSDDPESFADLDGHQSLDYLRQKAVAQAWKQERELVIRNGQGTRLWTAAEKAELLKTGRVAGYEGHHISSTQQTPPTPLTGI